MNLQFIKSKHIILILKLLLIYALLKFIFLYIDFDLMIGYIKKTNLFWLILAYIFFNLSQIISSIRSKIYLKDIKINLSYKYSIILYYIGMMLNIILPGGISGDGYKILKLGKKYNKKKLDILRIFLLERANGLLILMLLTFILASFSNIYIYIPYLYILLFLAIIITIFSYKLGLKYIFKEQITSSTLKISKYSLFVQILSILSALFIILALKQDNLITNIEIINYIILFLISSIISIIPISIGGVGLREMTFLIGTGFLQINAEFGVSIAIIFFFITLISSLQAILFYKKI